MNTDGYGWIRKDTDGYGRIWKDAEKCEQTGMGRTLFNSINWEVPILIMYDSRLVASAASSCAFKWVQVVCVPPCILSQHMLCDFSELFKHFKTILPRWMSQGCLLLDNKPIRFGFRRCDTKVVFYHLQLVRLDLFWDMLGTQSIHTKPRDIKCRLYKVLATFCSSLPMIYF